MKERLKYLYYANGNALRAGGAGLNPATSTTN